MVLDGGVSQEAYATTYRLDSEGYFEKWDKLTWYRAMLKGKSVAVRTTTSISPLIGAIYMLCGNHRDPHLVHIINVSKDCLITELGKESLHDIIRSKSRETSFEDSLFTA